ncbi:MAG: hypothetical protein D6707_10155, partial [Bacteroidetes bacterium]
EKIFNARETLRIPKEELSKFKNERRIFNSFVCNTPPGKHHFVFELLNPLRKKYFREEGEISVPAFGRSRLQMSDILLAYRVEPTADDGGGNVRQGFRIIPNPAAVYYPDQPLFLYCEVYNLLPKGSSGVSYYEVENTVYKASRPNLLKRIFGAATRSVGFLNQYEVAGRDDVLIQTIDLSNLKPGEYILELKVEDLMTREKVFKKHHFEIKAP